MEWREEILHTQKKQPQAGITGGGTLKEKKRKQHHLQPTLLQ